MRRHVGGSPEAFEALFRSAAAGDADVAGAAYPPGADPASGPLRLRIAHEGALIVEVERSSGSWGDFRLDTLFARGSFLFARPADLRSFWNGAVAKAFGLATEDGTPDPATLVDDLQVQLPRPARVAGGRRARTAPRRPTPTAAPEPTLLAHELGRRVFGQQAAVSRIATAVAIHLAKRTPRRPAVICLLGTTGVGKTSSIAALPDALARTGYGGAHVHRIDCGDCSTWGDASRVFGTAPGFVGYDDDPVVYRSLRRPGCILLLDEIEKAHSTFHAVILGLLDGEHVRAPNGTPVDVAPCIVAMTTNDGADELDTALHRIAHGNRVAVDATCRTHLRERGWASELVGRIDAMAAFAPLGASALQPAAEQAIHAQAADFGLTVVSLEPVLADVVLDLAERSAAGGRGLDHAARDLLGEAFAGAARDGVQGAVDVLAGPPPTVVPATAA